MIAGLVLSMIVGFLLFILFSLIVFWGSGFLLSRPFQKALTVLEGWALSPIIGLSVFSLVLYLAAFLQIRFLVTPVFLILGGTGLFFQFKEFRFKKSLFKRFDWLLTALIFLGILVQGSLVFFSGIKYSDGLKFFGANAHDGIWHLSLIQSLSQGFPPYNLAFSGALLRNYHFLSDLVASEISLVLPINKIDLFFRFLPIFYSGLFGLLVFVLTVRLTKKRAAGFLAVFLSYFAGSLGYLVPFLGVAVFSQESVFWSSQSVSLLLNTPLVSSFVLLLGGLILFDCLRESKNRWLILITGVVLGVNIGFKAYGGVLVLGALLICCGFWVVFRRQFYYSLVFLVSVTVSLTLFLLTNDFSSAGLFWSPGWFIQTMMVTPDHLNQIGWELLRQTYLAEQNTKRVILLWMIGLVIFVVGNLGTRIVFLLGIKKVSLTDLLKKPVLVLMTLMAFLGMAIPLLFLQKGVVWNSIQFFYYSLLILNILAAWVVTKMTEGSKTQVKVFVWVIFILLSIPTTVQTLQIYRKEFLGRANFTISNKQLVALNFLKMKKNSGMVLSSYHDSSYISGLSAHPVYFEDVAQALLLGDDPTDKNEFTRNFFCLGIEDPKVVLDLRQKQIQYVYLQTSDKCAFHETTELKSIFKNNEVEIIEVK